LASHDVLKGCRTAACSMNGLNRPSVALGVATGWRC
jgi:hypothetical protein